jgi:hypothetical protein
MGHDLVIVHFADSFASAAQQGWTLHVQHRILAKNQVVPGITPEQSRTLSYDNNRPPAQPRLLSNSLQHPRRDPEQRYQSHLGSPNNLVDLPSSGATRRSYHDTSVTPNHRPTLVLPHMSRLIPPENALPRPLPVQPDTACMSLHQAHLRSPIPAPRQLPVDSQPLYRHVTGYALPPTRPDDESYAQSITLFMSQADLDDVPSTSSGSLPGEPGIRVLQEGSVLYRLRCCKMPSATGFDTEASWLTADNVWPDNFIFQVNGRYLEPRRKLHHGRCLPIDLSEILHVGSNDLKVFTIPNPSNINTSIYVVAIEQVSVSSHTSIISTLTLISATDSLAAIKRSLKSLPDEDDDVSMTSSTLTIHLFGPYRNDRIYDTPVRGSTCLHRECFDLETFLSQCERERPGYPCVPDCWRCPICRGDVRPQTLVIDGFLVGVREKLAQQGLLNISAIVVEADGSWKPRIEAPSLRVCSTNLESGEAVMAAAANPRSSIVACEQGKQRIVEVIELD